MQLSTSCCSSLAPADPQVLAVFSAPLSVWLFLSVSRSLCSTVLSLFSLCVSVSVSVFVSLCCLCAQLCCFSVSLSMFSLRFPVFVDFHCFALFSLNFACFPGFSGGCVHGHGALARLSDSQPECWWIEPGHPLTC